MAESMVAGRADLGASTAMPDDEAQRLAVLRSYGILDTAAEPLFDELTALAAELCGTSMALISLVDESRQWFKSRIGVDSGETPRSQSFCAHALRRVDPLVVPDALLDPRFHDNPLVLGAPFIRFYAGAPRISREGPTLGTLCVLDPHPGALSDRQRRHLTLLAGQVTALLDGHRQARELATEVAERRRTELAMEATDRLLRGVLSHPDAVVYAKDLDGRYVFGNDALHALFTAAPGSLMGRRDADLVDPAAAAGFRQTDQRVAATGDRVVVQETLPHPDGSTRHYLSTKFPLRDDDGAVYAVAGMSTDITAQVRAADRVQASERRWRLLFDASPVGIGLADADGVIVAANAALCALYGRAHAEVIGSTGAAFSHPDDVAAFGDAHALLARSETGVAQVEKRYLRPDGEVRWAWLTVTRTPGPAGEVWILAHAQDITERLEAERVVRDSEANLSAVAEVVAQIQAGSDARETIVRACAELARARDVCLFEPDPQDAGQLRVTRTTTPALAGFVLDRSLPSAICRAFDDPDAVRDAPDGHPFPAAVLSDHNVMVVPVRAGRTVMAVLTLGFDHGAPPEDHKRNKVVRLLAGQAAVAMRQSALLADLAARAVTDALTGLPNRRGWDDAVRRMVSDAGPGRRMVVALIDFDHFKIFNDTRGHAAGDELLRGFADRARAALRAGDILARWGGEEFALALPHCATDTDAEAVLQRVAGSMPSAQTCSIGWARVAAGCDLAQSMIEADTALYAAKAAGRNRIRHF